MLCLYLFTLCLYLSLSGSRGLAASSSVQMEPCVSPVPCKGGARTLVLAVVHAVLGGVVVFDQTSALGGVRFIRNVLLLLLLLLEGQLSALLWFLAVSQRL